MAEITDIEVIHGGVKITFLADKIEIIIDDGDDTKSVTLDDEFKLIQGISISEQNPLV